MLVLIVMVMLSIQFGGVCGLPSSSVLKRIHHVNSLGHHLGIVVPNAYEMDPLLNNSIFQPYSHVPTIDIGGMYVSLSLSLFISMSISHSCAFIFFSIASFFRPTILHWHYRIPSCHHRHDRPLDGKLIHHTCSFWTRFREDMYVEGKSMNISYARSIIIKKNIFVCSILHHFGLIIESSHLYLSN